MPYNIESFGISDLGLVRGNNEDVFHEIPLHRFFVLADGMGGHNAGEIAAKEAVYHLSTSVCQIFSAEEQPDTQKSLPELIHKAILNANHWVHQLSEQKEELNGMGTTLCCLLLHDDSLICAHVGDSRVYRFREDLKQITADHSLDPTSRKHVITRAIGTSPHVEPDISITPIHPGDIHFLCSDGLTDYVSDTEISTILDTHSCITAASKKMIEIAKSKGGSDNITVLMVKVLHGS